MNFIKQVNLTFIPLPFSLIRVCLSVWTVQLAPGRIKKDPSSVAQTTWPVVLILDLQDCIQVVAVACLNQAVEVVDLNQVVEVVDLNQVVEVVDLSQVVEVVDLNQAVEVVDLNQVVEMVDLNQAVEVVCPNQLVEVVDLNQAVEVVDLNQAVEVAFPNQAVECQAMDLFLDIEILMGLPLIYEKSDGFTPGE